MSDINKQKIEKIRQRIASTLGGINVSNVIQKFKIGERSKNLENCIWIIENTTITEIKNNIIFLKYKLEFKKCKFINEINIKINSNNSKVVKELYINSCTFDQKINCRNIYFEYISIAKSKFISDVNFEIFKNSEKLYCEKNIFEGECHIQSEKEYGDKRCSIVFIDNTFYKNIEISNLYIKELLLLKTNNSNNVILEIKNSSIDYFILPNSLRQCNISNTTLAYPIREKRSFNYKINFKKCVFEKEVDFSESTFTDANFSKSTFKGVTNFKGCIFGNEINTEKTIDLSEIVFEDNVYFDESIFNHFVAFHSTSFKKTASFYRVEFNTMPNFSPGDFQGILNLNNAKWFGSKAEEAFEFDIIKNNIQKAYENHNFIENVINFRSSFCGIKNVLLGKQNLLDAKNFHKAELYCKEMELEYELADSKNKITQQDKQSKSLKKPKKEEINIIRFLKFLFSILKNTVVFLFKAIVNTLIFIECIFVSPIFLISYLSCSFVFMLNDMLNYLFSVEKCSWKRKISTWWYKINSKNIIDFTKWFEYMSLLVYRNTSDHHTNLNKIFHFTLLMIANFAISLFFIELINNYTLLHRRGDEIYMILNMFFAVIFLIVLWIKMDKIHYLHIHAIIFLFLIFFIIMLFNIPLSFILKKEISQIIFGLLFYILATVFSYLIFVQNRNTTIKLTRFFSYFGFILALITSPEIINPMLNIFNKENIENKNLVNKLNQTDYDILSNLTRLSFRNYNIDNNTTFSESNIVNQKEIIISNKATLEHIFGFLFLRNTKEGLNKILENIDNTKKIDEILKDNKNRSVALDLAYAASGQYSRTLKDMEIKDEARLWLLKTLRIHKDEKEAREEITNDIEILADAINQSKEIMIRLKNIVEKYDEYLGIYKSIRLDKITSQTYKSTYILYVIIMILCLYSLIKTARKKSIIS